MTMTDNLEEKIAPRSFNIWIYGAKWVPNLGPIYYANGHYHTDLSQPLYNMVFRAGFRTFKDS